MELQAGSRSRSGDSLEKIPLRLDHTGLGESCVAITMVREMLEKRFKSHHNCYFCCCFIF